MNLCSDIGLNALIQVVLENAPSWLVNQHPEARYEAKDDQKIQAMGRLNTPGGGLPCLCHNNPPTSKAAGMFISSLVAHFTGHLACWVMMSGIRCGSNSTATSETNTIANAPP